MISKKLKLLNSIPNWLLLVSSVVIGLAIIVFNDELGDNKIFIFGAFFYFVFLFFLFVRWLFKQIKLVIKLKNEQAKTELLHLKSQVNPHFFFNMLNNLYGLVDQDAKKAQQLILKLSDMMRYSIYEGQKDTVPLSKEIDYLKNYIELHKMRYHKVIDVQFKVDVKESDYNIMPLLFIILLENAFKHGVENLREGAYVHVTLTAAKKEVYFSLENNFEISHTKEPVGMGLTNLKRRLDLVYPKNHYLSLDKTKGVYKAKLIIKNL